MGAGIESRLRFRSILAICLSLSGCSSCTSPSPSPPFSLKLVGLSSITEWNHQQVKLVFRNDNPISRIKSSRSEASRVESRSWFGFPTKTTQYIKFRTMCPFNKPTARPGLAQNSTDPDNKYNVQAGCCPTRVPHTLSSCLPVSIPFRLPIFPHGLSVAMYAVATVVTGIKRESTRR